MTFRVGGGGGSAERLRYDPIFPSIGASSGNYDAYIETPVARQLPDGILGLNWTRLGYPSPDWVRRLT
jgi:hypothetical protein